MPEADGASDLTGLRVLLVADVLMRAAELRNLQVLTVLASDGQSEVLERAAGMLGIHPPAARASSDGIQAALGGPIDVHLTTHDARTDGRLNGLVARVGTARADRRGDTVEGLVAGHEPLAVRLALLSFPYHQPAELTGEVLAEARSTVGHWRLRVAEWAQSPSRPVPAQIAETVQSAFGDLDTVSVLGLLRGLASGADLPRGAKFETFLYADRILGLDLPRDIGRA
jgi:hypothetical protein